MSKAIVFLSTRQLSQVDFSMDLLKKRTLILISSNKEIIEFPKVFSSRFKHHIPVSITSDDGVIFEYNELEVIKIFKDLKKSYSHLDTVCFDEGNINLAEKIRQRSNSLGSILERFRDKVLMKKLLIEEAIPVPRFIESFSDHINFHDICESVGLPFVIKPRRSAGSNNIHIIRSKDEFLKVKYSIGELRHTYEVEQYIEGNLYHCDIALWKGKSIFSECTEYLKPTIDFQSGSPLGGRVMEMDCELRHRLIVFAQKALSSLRSKDGVYHMEIFVENNETKKLIFLEVGARPPGMLVTTMYEKATGVNLLNLDIMIQTDSVPNNFTFSRKQEAFYLVYPKGKGQVSTLNTPEFDNRLEVSFHIVSSLGDNHEGCYSNLDFCAHITCSGSEKSIVDKAYAQMSCFQPLLYKNINCQ